MKSSLQAMGVLRPAEGNSQEPVALETTVIATGARPGDTASDRKLFAEETQTVLVFEHGAVIRLAAGVADGQLLFLTNKATGKEVVTQVVRKRAFRPTNCYVDLEFTENCPGFWGIEFPKPGEASSAAKAQIDADPDTYPASPTTPPSVHEVQRLKQEVAELQNQLKSLTVATPKTAESADSEPMKSAPEIAADLAKKEEARQLQELFELEAKLDQSMVPTRLVAYPQKTSKVETVKRNSKKIAAAAVLFLVAGGVYAYQFGALDALVKKSAPVKAAPTNVPAKVAAPGNPAASGANPNNAAANSAANTSAVKGASAPDAASGTGAQGGALPNTVLPNTPLPNTVTPNQSAVNAQTAATKEKFLDNASAELVSRSNSIKASNSKSGDDSATRAIPVTKDLRHSRTSRATEAHDLPSQPVSHAESLAAPTGSEPMANAAAVSGDYVGPKLLKAVKPVAPPEIMKNYVTGSVNVDAVVDVTGHVRSVTVLSGPTKLRANAIEEMKQYLYAPAKQNGKPVPSHLRVTLQYWYEP